MGTGPRNPAANRLRSSTNPRLLPQTSASGKQISSSQERSFLWIRLSRVTPWWALGVMLIATGCIAGGAWLGLQLMVNPQTLIWINRFIPDWIPIPITGLKPPQTLEQIRRELTQAGRIPGDVLVLGKNVSFVDGKSKVSDLLLPVLTQQPNCQTNCEQIVELRVYQPALGRGRGDNREQYFQLVNQLAIVGPEESFAIAPLIDAKSANQGSTRVLPLTSLSQFEQNVPPQGVWLNLNGRLIRGEGTVAYGQIIHYNPGRFHLSFMLEWSSSTNEEPIWQEVTGGGLPELLINQTVGLEPQFRIYQVKPRDFLPNPIQLESVLLLEPAINNPIYSKALVLARSGLWSTSEKWLQSLKQKYGKKWTAPAQAQLDLVHRHAEATQTQAENSWASPSQQVLANLIDGRWERALQVFERSSQNSLETGAMLKGDPGRLRDRVEAALQIEPKQRSAKAWGGLLIAAQRGQRAAIAWLRKQPKTTAADIAYVSSLIKRLEASSFVEPEPISSAPGQIVGSVTPLNGINPSEWLKPKQSPALKLEDQQMWYRVQVAGFHDDKRWRFSDNSFGIASSTSVGTLWKLLGLLSDPPLQIIFWLPDGQQETVYASIKAVRVQAGGIQLLAAGDKVGIPGKRGRDRPRPLAVTDSTLQWLSPPTISLNDLVQQQPEWATAAIPALTRELRKELPPGTAPTWEALSQLGIGDWLVQLAPLTDSNQSDVVLTVQPELLANLDNSGKTKAKHNVPTRTLIFSATGKLLYSEFSTDSALTFLAMADLGDGSPTALVVDGPSNYNLLRWSAKRKRFE